MLDRWLKKYRVGQTWRDRPGGTDLEGQTWRDRSWTGPRTDLEGTGPGQVLGQVLGQTWRDRSWTGPRTDLEGQVLERS